MLKDWNRQAMREAVESPSLKTILIHYECSPEQPAVGRSGTGLQSCHPASVPPQFYPVVLSHSTKLQLPNVCEDILEGAVLLYSIRTTEMVKSVNKDSKLNERLNKICFLHMG